MIQEIAPHKLHNEFRAEAVPEQDDIVLGFAGTEVFVKPADVPAFFRLKDLHVEKPVEQMTYLFSVDDQAYWLWTSDAPMEAYVSKPGQGAAQGGRSGSIAAVSLRTLREQNSLPKETAFAVYTAKHLADWYRDNRFCGRCGKALSPSPKERAMVCSCCGYTSYPRIMPAVIVGVVDGDRLLLTKYRVGYRHNALIAGFTEIGETLEETVAREVMEEAGIRVKNIRYYKSQPWGIANDLLVGFFCEADGDVTIRMDEQELSCAEWTKREDIVLQPDNYSLTNEMMAAFKNGGI